MTNSLKPDVPTTSNALHEEFVRGGWEIRLSKCSKGRVDKTITFDDGEKEYHARTVSRHYEDGIQIAISITHYFHAGNSRTTYKMLLIDGARHYVP